MAVSPQTPNQPFPEARWLIGRLSEHRDLLARLDERPGLLVLEADPLSGTSALVALAIAEITEPAMIVDARALDSSADLAFAIASTAVQRFDPEAFAWWNGSSDVLDAPAVRLMNLVHTQGLGYEELREARIGRTGHAYLRRALGFAALLAHGPAWLVIDHLDALLERVNEPTSIEILGVLRADRQNPGQPVDQLLIGRTDGRLAAALDDVENPMYRAGQKLRVRRARPSQFVDDLAIGHPWVDGPAEWVGAAADLAAGCPAYVWRLVDEAHRNVQEGDGPLDAVARSWQAMCRLSEPGYAQRYQELASINPASPLIVSAIANGVGPYALGLNSKRAHDALTRLRARGTIFAPKPRTWTISDPMLAAWARATPPPSLRRLAENQPQ